MGSQNPGGPGSPARAMAANHVCTTVGGSTRLKITTSGIGSRSPMTVFDALQRTANCVPQRIALNTKRSGSGWESWTFRRLIDEIKLVAKALIRVFLTKTS